MQIVTVTCDCGATWTMTPRDAVVGVPVEQYALWLFLQAVHTDCPLKV